MGLDITSYEHVKLVEEVHAIEDSEGNYCNDTPEFGGKNHVTTYNEGSFPHTLGSLIVGKCYLASGEQFRFRAGSYSGYSRFREALCLEALGVSANTVWAEPEKYVGRPFYEMINFSDCEGVVGHEVCLKLTRDFQEGRETVRARLEQTDDHGFGWYADSYDNWQKAYELASVDGMVKFH
jgi:hypothetical protein